MNAAGGGALVGGGRGGIGRATVPALAAADHIAAVIAFLASPQAGHITGQVIRVDGGRYL